MDKPSFITPAMLKFIASVYKEKGILFTARRLVQNKFPRLDDKQVRDLIVYYSIIKDEKPKKDQK